MSQNDSRPVANRVNSSGLRYWVTKPDMTARCMDCDWEGEGPNIQGVGALHSKRERHEVRVDIHRVIAYCGDQT